MADPPMPGKSGAMTVKCDARRGISGRHILDVAFRLAPRINAAGRMDVASDIIEHVDDDARALAEIARVLRPGGTVLITVPAFPSLWGFQDEVGHHKRRYRMEPLVSRIEAAGLSLSARFHFNYLLFGPIWLARQLMKRWKHSYSSEGQINTPLMNRIFSRVFDFDTMTASRISPPFGVSILAIARKPGA